MLYKVPIRITWRINTKNNNLTKNIAKSLINSKIFFLKIILNSCKLDENIFKVINELIKENIRISLQVKIEAIDRIFTADVSMLKISNLIVDIKSFNDMQKNIKSLEVLTSFKNIRKSANISLTNNCFINISLLIQKLIDYDFKEVIFSNPELVGKKIEKKEKYLFNKNDFSCFKNSIEDLIPLCEKISFTIHDYFLWKEFSAKTKQVTKGEYSGCQAGNILAYISGNGDIYPCSSLPIKLGNLSKNTFAEIWNTLERKELCDKIKQELEICVNCKFSDCNGGCKGITYFLYNSFNFQDLLCPFNIQHKKNYEV